MAWAQRGYMGLRQLTQSAFTDAMKQACREVTYRRGRAVAACYCLPRRPEEMNHGDD